MKQLIFILSIVISICQFSFGQTKGVRPIAINNIEETGVTRAVVVGISDYQNDNITDLQYADVDAKVFATYLTSPDGLNLDSSNVTVLLNENATSGQFVSALYGLLEESEEGDLAIIYFSGHGDVESTTINQPGFLLCWDSPARVYMGGGTFGLAYMQEIISTLSLKTKSRVLVITDACRAGKLAGSEIGGSHATAANLSKQYANEVKILSCQPDELALEGETWGGGRGVFSYYLMAGLQGLADKNENGEVTLSEIERYLEDNVSDAVAPHSQIPLTVGNRNSVVSIVNAKVYEKLKAEGIESGFNPVDSRSVLLQKEDFVDSLDFDYYSAFNNAMESGHYLYPRQGSAYEIFNKIKDLDELAKYINIMRRNLAASLQDEAQQAINDYLAADPSELKTRWTFNEKYNKYPESLQKAAELIGPDHFFYNTLLARSLYFEGLTYRLKGQMDHNDSLIYNAIELQDSSLSIEPNAPYALNEKGYCNYILQNYPSAISSYQKALELSPTWALVYSNICGAYNELGEYEKGLQFGYESIQLDSTLIFGKYNTGSSYQGLGNQDSALYYFNEVLKTDSLYWHIYVKFGYIASQQNDHKKAELNYKKAIEIYNRDINTHINLAHTYLKLNQPEKAKLSFENALTINPNSEQAMQGMIEYSYYTGNLNKAEFELSKYLKSYPEDNFAYFLLSSIYAGQSKSDKALLALKEAFEKGFDKIDLVQQDVNFNSIRNTAEFESLIEKYSVKKE